MSAQGQKCSPREGCVGRPKPVSHSSPWSPALMLCARSSFEPVALRARHSAMAGSAIGCARRHGAYEPDLASIGVGFRVAAPASGTA